MYKISKNQTKIDNAAPYLLFAKLSYISNRFRAILFSSPEYVKGGTWYGGLYMSITSSP
jgi:hypothetical protein